MHRKLPFTVLFQFLEFFPSDDDGHITYLLLSSSSPSILGSSLLELDTVRLFIFLLKVLEEKKGNEFFLDMRTFPFLKAAF